MEKHESDMTNREKWERQWETIKSLKGRKKWEYLWTYYKSYLIMAGAVIFVLYAACVMIHNLMEETVLSIVFIDAGSRLKESEESIEQQIANQMGLSDWERVEINTSVISADTEENIAKMTVELSTVSGNDLVICDEEVYKKYKNAGAFADIEKVLGGEYGKYVSYMEQGELDLSKAPKKTESEDLAYSPAYICVLKNTEHIEEIKEFLQCIY